MGFVRQDEARTAAQEGRIAQGKETAEAFKEALKDLTSPSSASKPTQA